MALTNIFLHGRLGKAYGHEWKLDVRSPAEAIRAIDANLKGRLKEQLYKEGTKKFYKVCLGNVENPLEKNELSINSGRVDIHIVPVPKGRKSGLGKILAAAAIIALMVWNPGAAFIGAKGLTMWGTMAATAAASLALGGVVQMLTPTPNFNQNSDGDGRGSSLFQGNSVVTTQGSTVGLVYGRMMVTPMPVSIAFDNYDQAASSNDFRTVQYTTRYNAETGVLEQVPVSLEE